MSLFTFDTFVHLFAGGLGGTFGAVATCPLEVVKTRLQSSVATFSPISQFSSNNASSTATMQMRSMWQLRSSLAAYATRSPHSVVACITHIIHTEGPKALFKGLGPNIVGVAPSRAIYFCAYSQVKSFTNLHLTPDTPYVHMISAASAGFISCTLTNPIWFIKTRMQLDESKCVTTVWDCIRTTYKTTGIAGFYKGITASYVGISETIIHFVLYEYFKSKLFDMKIPHDSILLKNGEQKLNFCQYMCAAATSKSIASIIAYPHEVARTRLREEGNKYSGFVQTLMKVYREEGLRNGLYRGLCTQLLRQIPNTAIMMGTYEIVVYAMKNIPFNPFRPRSVDASSIAIDASSREGSPSSPQCSENSN